MHGGREEKCDADFFEASGNAGGRQIDLCAQSFHYIRRAALGRDAAIAVLGYAHTGSRDYEGGCGGNVKGAARVAAGAAGIDERVAAGATGVEDVSSFGMLLGVEFERRGGSANGFGEAYDFFDRFALHVERNQQGGDLRVRALAGEDL